MLGYTAGKPRSVWVSASPSSGDERQPDRMAVPVIAAGSQPPAAALPDGAALPADPLAAGLDAPPDGEGLAELLHAANRKTVTTARVNSFGRMATSSRCPAGEARGACTGPRSRVRLAYGGRGFSQGSAAA